MGIPKIIHYCWFGKEEKPKIVQECIESWRNCLNDYKIIEWNEENFPIKEFNFTTKAYEDNNWIFVSEYCRLYALYNYGGIYLETDMEILKSIDDLLDNSSFGGLEDGAVAFGIWGCKKYDKFILEVLKYYNNLNYEDYKKEFKEDGIKIQLSLIAEYFGYNRNTKNISIFYNNVAIYPDEYFYPKNNKNKNYKSLENAYCRHCNKSYKRRLNYILKTKFKKKVLKYIRGFK
ncbi:MAG: mannosyltransferase [Clostridium sp.]|nr:mannosyltransferase [Clostridium sp.]